MNKQTTTLLAAVTLASTSFAGTTVVSSKEYKQPMLATACFQDQEFTFDLSYSYNDAIGGGGRHAYLHDRSGGGAGASFFFARYFGIGVEGNWFGGGTSGTVLHQVTGNLIFRYPMEIRGVCAAPYVFVGGGEVLDGKKTALADVGLGAEIRLTPRVGLFSDWRYNFMSNDRGDLGTARAGVRFAF